MAKEALRAGVQTMNKTKAENIIISTAYDTWQRELDLQVADAINQGICESKICVLSNARNSYDEAVHAIALAKNIGAEKLVIIAEEWHAKRSLRAFRYGNRHKSLEIEMVTFRTPHFEVSLEPSMIKSFRSGNKFAWIAWNVLIGLIPPKWLSPRK